MKLIVNWPNVSLAIGLALSLYLCSCGGKVETNDTKTDAGIADNSQDSQNSNVNDVRKTSDASNRPGLPRDSGTGIETVDGMGNYHPVDAYSDMVDGLSIDTSTGPVQCPACENPSIGCCIREDGTCIVNALLDYACSVPYFHCVNCP